MNKRCINCSEYKNCRESSVSYIFFIIGIISAISIRLVTILSNLRPIYGQISWYIGVLGFLFFFIYKFRVEKRRQKIIIQKELINKIKKEENLNREDYNILFDILCSLSSNKDRINYFIIFLTSTIAIIIALYFDIIKKFFEF